MSAPVRLTVVLTHPIQYYSPWFRHIHAHAPEIALTVVYATQPSAEQQGVGFERAFEWDVPLLEGYRSITVRPARAGDRIDTAQFMAVDAPGIGDAILGTGPDVVVIAGWYSISLVRALAACRRRGIPTLYRGDSNLLSGPRGWRRSLWSVKTRLFLWQFDGFLSPGRRADEYLHRHGAPAYRIFRVPHAVDNGLFAGVAAQHRDAAARADARGRLGIPPDRFVPLFAGKMVARKRPLDLVRAAAKLGPGVSVLTAGSGPLDAAMESEAQSLGVDLKAMGFVNQTALGEAYAIADCLVLPSDASETWGLVVNEALASGLPAVVSDEVGCAPDLIATGETGAVFARGNVAELASALDAIRQRTTAGHDWSPACRMLAAGYDFAAMTAGLVRACRSVIRHSPGAEPEWTASPQRVVVPCGQMVVSGGLERMTFEVLRVLREQGMSTHVIVNAWENFRITPLAEASGASWSVGPYWHTLRRRGLTPAVVFRMLLEIVRVSIDLVRVSRRIRPTHVLMPDFVAVLRNFLGLAWLRARGVRVIARLGTAPPPGAFYRQLWRRVVDPVVDLFVANSEFTRRELIAHGIRAEKVAMIENVAPARKDSAAVDAPRIPGRIVFVGQIIPDKGLDLLLDAIGLLRRRGLDATLDVAGQIDGWEAPEYRGYRAALRDRARQPDLAAAVQFLGFREDVPVLLARGSVHCCPSRPEHREGFGLVVLEAKIAGLPSVVTPSGNLPGMVDHERDGWVCRRADAEAIAEGLEYFLTRPDELAAAGRAALASAGRYNERRFAAAWTRIFANGQIEHAHAT
jgi:glycosyltransferase involved in cell wall biosynthesis